MPKNTRTMSQTSLKQLDSFGFLSFSCHLFELSHSNRKSNTRSSLKEKPYMKNTHLTSTKINTEYKKVYSFVGISFFTAHSFGEPQSCGPLGVV